MTVDTGAGRATLRPLFDRVVVKELDRDKVRQSGLVMPDTLNEHRQPPMHGIVVAVGTGLDWWNGAGVEMPVAVGDHVVFPSVAGIYVEISEEKLLALRVGEIIGVIEDVR